MRVLVVEDEPLLAMLLEESLAELGHVLAGSAATAAQALAMLDAEDVDCALLDFSLGQDATSIPVARRLHSDGKPFYFLTGHMSLSESPGMPVDAPILTKPVRLDELDNALREMAGIAG